MAERHNITQIELYKMDIPLEEPFVISLQTIDCAYNVLIIIKTNSGLVGYGEASPYQTILAETQETCWSVGQLLARSLVGKQALAIEANIQALDDVIKCHHCIKSGFDMALHDLAAQSAGLPLYAYLGGSNDKPLVTDMTIGLNDIATTRRKAAQFVQEGFEEIKVKVGTTPEKDEERIRSIREEVGSHIQLKIDANQGWTIPQAKKALKQLAKYDIGYCEAPISTSLRSALPTIKEESPIPIMADESLFDHYDAWQLAYSQSCDFFNIKLAKSGGILKALKIAAIGEAAGIYSQVGCFSESRLGITALAHLALARKNIIYYDMDSALMLAKDPVKGGIYYGKGGAIQVTEEPGLGVRFEATYLNSLERVVINSVT